MEIDMEKLAQDLREIRAMNRQWEKKLDQSQESKKNRNNKNGGSSDN